MSGDDAQVLLYDLTSPLPAESSSRNNASYSLSPPATPNARTPSPSSSRAVELQPARAWNAGAEVNNLAFSQTGEWLGCVSGQRLSVLQV